MPDEKPSNDIWEFDFTKWNLDDVIAFEEGTLRSRLPLMAKALVRNPYGVDLNNPKDRGRIDAYQWAEIQRQFVEKMKAIFQ